MAARSAVSTLHARLNLPTSYAHSTLQRCLVDKSASSTSNNASLAVLGNHVLGYYVSSHVLTKYPRLPYRATKNALISYAGWNTLADIGRGWGVEGVPKEELRVNSKLQKPTRPGTAPTAEELTAMLQFSRVAPGNVKDRRKNMAAEVEGEQYSDQAYADFVRAVVGGMHIHAGAAGARQFIDQHVLSRDLQISRTFRLTAPQRELSFLCKREGLEAPITRLIAETGRRTNSPVFVVGVYSGAEKLGEGQASSLKEATFMAQTNAMKAWYLFENKGATLSSRTIEEDWNGKNYVPAMIGTGDVVY